MKFTLLFIALALCTSSWAESIKGSPNIYGAGYHWGCSTLNNDQSEMADLVALQWIMGFHSGLSFAGAFTDHAPKGHNLCSGQLIPDSDLGFSSATAGAIPPL